MDLEKYYCVLQTPEQIPNEIDRKLLKPDKSVFGDESKNFVHRYSATPCIYLAPRGIFESIVRSL